MATTNVGHANKPLSIYFGPSETCWNTCEDDVRYWCARESESESLLNNHPPELELRDNWDEKRLLILCHEIKWKEEIDIHTLFISNRL